MYNAAMGGEGRVGSPSSERTSSALEGRRPSDLPGLVPLSVIVPTLNEAENIGALIARLERVLPTDSEVIFVDDSDDETPAVIRAAREQARYPIRLHHRAPHQRNGGQIGRAHV